LSKKQVRNAEDVFFEAEEFMQYKPIKCFKYNHALDASVQNFNEFPAIIKLSVNG